MNKFKLLIFVSSIALASIQVSSAFTLVTQPDLDNDIYGPLLDTSNVSGSIFIGLGDNSQDFVNGGVATQVNDDGMFGYNDWDFSGRFNFGGAYENNDIGLVIDDNTQSGIWSLTNLGSATDVMIVLKSGGGQAEPDLYVGYLLNDNVTSGTYSTPFNNPNGQQPNPKNLSHFSVYTRGATFNAVPEPSTYAMFGAAFLILGVTGYRSRNRRS